jgi:hypothetical protein
MNKLKYIDAIYILIYIIIFNKEFNIKIIYKIFKFISLKVERKEQIKLLQYIKFFNQVNGYKHKQFNIKVITSINLFNIFKDKKLLIHFFKLNIFDKEKQLLLLNYIQNKLDKNKLLKLL